MTVEANRAIGAGKSLSYEMMFLNTIIIIRFS